MRLAIRLARMTMEEGEFQRSREILEHVVEAPEFEELPPEDRVAALFALGQALNELGEHREAVRRYRQILVAHPELVRVRLELARSFFLLGDDELADYHFRYVLAGELPEAVEINVRRYLREIRLRRRWSFDLGFRVVQNTNINAAPTVRQIELFGLPFELDDAARAKSGVGVGGFVTGEYRQPLTDTVQARLGGHFDYTRYSDDRFNDAVLAAHAGPLFLFDGGALGDSAASFLLQGYRRWFGDSRFSYGIGPALEFSAEPADRVRVGFRVDHLFVRYDKMSDSDGTVTSATMQPAVILSPVSIASMILGVTYDRTDYDRLRNVQYRFGLAYRRDLQYGFTVSFQPEYRYVTYPREWAGFNARRRDHLVLFRSDILNRRIAFYGFTPVLGYRFQQRSSTIDMFEFNQHRLELSLTRRF